MATQTSPDGLLGLVKNGSLWLGSRDNTSPSSESKKLLRFNLPEIDSQFAGLSFGAVHEWSLKEEVLNSSSPPFLILASLLQSALQSKPDRRMILWVGEKCWPSFKILDLISENTDWSWKTHCLFIRPQSKSERIYILRKALASPSLLSVIGDISGISLTTSRQLQLAARVGGGIGFLCHSQQGLLKTSCAQTKWLVSPKRRGEKRTSLFEAETLAWNLELLRAPGIPQPLRWEIKWENSGLASDRLEIPSIINETKYAIR